MNSRAQPGPVRNIVILGGGSAGWMAAAYLSHVLNGDAPNVTITLVASDTIGTVGVGEGTVPSIHPVFFDVLGIPETAWMPACNASYKLGIKFVNWAHPPSERGDTAFYHTFGESLEVDGIPLTHFWLRKSLAGWDRPFSQACYPSAALCDAERAPVTADGASRVPHAYHFDATLLGGYLRRWATDRGVRHVTDDIRHVALTPAGDIDHLEGISGREYRADLFLDCTGFAALLMDQTLHEPFVSYEDSLLCDRAVAIRVPDNERGRVRPYTTATALDAGWVWQIDLDGRSGNGYVYSSQFLSDDAAESALRTFLGPRAEGAAARRLDWRVGRNRRAWVGNCISLGLSAGFVEPLEATGIYFVFAALHHLARYFPTAAMEPALREKFNERIAYMYDDVKDFLVLHYCTTHREDTPFWRTNRHDLRIPASLQHILREYRAGVPMRLPYTGATYYNQLAFDASFDRFWTNSNYVAVLAGMDVLPDRPMPILEFMPQAAQHAEETFAAVERRTKLLLRELPPHAELLAQRRPRAAA